MSKRKKIIIIDKHIYGQLTDSFKWFQNLRKYYDTQMICFANPNIENWKECGLKPIPFYNSKSLRGIFFILNSIITILSNPNAKILVVYFQKCSILKKFLFWRRMGVDIRTLSVNEKPEIRNIYDSVLKKEIQRFDVISTISQGVKEKLNLQESMLLPLGSDVISQQRRNYISSINLLYVGTFTGRNIDRTVEAVALFHMKHPEIPITYNLIGFGSEKEEKQIHDLITKYGLEKIILYRGRIPHDKIGEYFDESNVGLSFVPIVDYFDIQPPTKTFEYAQSGIITIATPTIENKKIITKDNGILLKDDTVQSLAESLEDYWLKRFNYNEYAVRNSLSDYSWNNITEKFLLPILEKI